MKPESLFFPQEETQNPNKIPFGNDLLVRLNASLDMGTIACLQDPITPVNGIDPGSGNQDDWPKMLLNQFPGQTPPESLN